MTVKDSINEWLWNLAEPNNEPKELLICNQAMLRGAREMGMGMEEYIEYLIENKVLTTE